MGRRECGCQLCLTAGLRGKADSLVRTWPDLASTALDESSFSSSSARRAGERTWTGSWWTDSWQPTCWVWSQTTMRSFIHLELGIAVGSNHDPRQHLLKSYIAREHSEHDFLVVDHENVESPAQSCICRSVAQPCESMCGAVDSAYVFYIGQVQVS